MTIKFGPSGNSDIFYQQGHKSSLEMPAWLRDMGLDAYEYSFGRGIRIKEATARALGENAKAQQITVSVHAPYYINLATPDPDKRRNSINYIVNSVIAADWMGANRVVVHPGVPGKKDRREALEMAKEVLAEALEEIDRLGLGYISLCPETMGKKNQLGTIDEIMELCSLDKRLIPAIDFGHIHARGEGAINGKEDYARILDALEFSLKDERASSFHMHFSRIEFTSAGESRHWNLKDVQYGPEFEPLAELLVERKLQPTVICESKGMMAEDALQLKKIYLNKLNQRG